MECWSQGSLERAAIRMADAGIAPGCAPSAAVAADLVSLLAHAQTCTRCRGVLHILFDAEVLMRARGHRPIVLPLRLLDPTGASRGMDAETPPGWRESYPVAAQTPEIGRRIEDGTTPSRVLTLTTSDDRFLVRILPNNPGPGATAILYPARGGVTIEIDGKSFAFDETGTATLPGFPGADISLVLR